MFLACSSASCGSTDGVWQRWACVSHRWEALRRRSAGCELALWRAVHRLESRRCFGRRGSLHGEQDHAAGVLVLDAGVKQLETGSRVVVVRTRNSCSVGARSGEKLWSTDARTLNHVPQADLLLHSWQAVREETLFWQRRKAHTSITPVRWAQPSKPSLLLRALRRRHRPLRSGLALTPQDPDAILVDNLWTRRRGASAPRITPHPTYTPPPRLPPRPPAPASRPRSQRPAAQPSSPHPPPPHPMSMLGPGRAHLDQPVRHADHEARVELLDAHVHQRHRLRLGQVRLPMRVQQRVAKHAAVPVPPLVNLLH